MVEHHYYSYSSEQDVKNIFCFSSKNTFLLICMNSVTLDWVGIVPYCSMIWNICLVYFKEERLNQRLDEESHLNKFQRHIKI